LAKFFTKTSDTNSDDTTQNLNMSRHPMWPKANASAITVTVFFPKNFANVHEPLN